MHRNKLVIIFALFLLTPLHSVHAGDFVEDQPTIEDSGSDSNFDPFSDYSEFEENSEEEADTNFFHNGRFFSLALNVGYSSFTSTLGQIYKPDLTYGAFLTYFFDLKFGFQVGYMTANHVESIVNAATGITYSGTMSLQHFEFDGKYYFNTQNVTKGLGTINPYLLFGSSYYTRTQSFVTGNTYAQDSELGIQAGLGVEIPMMKNKMYFGAQVLYGIINFPDKGNPIILNNTATSIYPSGDNIRLDAIIGLNF